MVFNNLKKRVALTESKPVPVFKLVPKGIGWGVRVRNAISWIPGLGWLRPTEFVLTPAEPAQSQAHQNALNHSPQGVITDNEIQSRLGRARAVNSQSQWKHINKRLEIAIILARQYLTSQFVTLEVGLATAPFVIPNATDSTDTYSRMSTLELRFQATLLLSRSEKFFPENTDFSHVITQLGFLEVQDYIEKFLRIGTELFVRNRVWIEINGFQALAREMGFKENGKSLTKTLDDTFTSLDFYTIVEDPFRCPHTSVNVNVGAEFLNRVRNLRAALLNVEAGEKLALQEAAHAMNLSLEDTRDFFNADHTSGILKPLVNSVSTVFSKGVPTVQINKLMSLQKEVWQLHKDLFPQSTGILSIRNFGFLLLEKYGLVLTLKKLEEYRDQFRALQQHANDTYLEMEEKLQGYFGPDMFKKLLDAFEQREKLNLQLTAIKRAVKDYAAICDEKWDVSYLLGPMLAMIGANLAASRLSTAQFRQSRQYFILSTYYEVQRKLACLSWPESNPTTKLANGIVFELKSDPDACQEFVVDVVKSNKKVSFELVALLLRSIIFKDHNVVSEYVQDCNQLLEEQQNQIVEDAKNLGNPDLSVLVMSSNSFAGYLCRDLQSDPHMVSRLNSMFQESPVFNTISEQVLTDTRVKNAQNPQVYALAAMLQLVLKNRVQVPLTPEQQGRVASLNSNQRAVQAALWFDLQQDMGRVVDGKIAEFKKYNREGMDKLRTNIFEILPKGNALKAQAWFQRFQDRVINLEAFFAEVENHGESTFKVSIPATILAIVVSSPEMRAEFAEISREGVTHAGRSYQSLTQIFIKKLGRGLLAWSLSSFVYDWSTFFPGMIEYRDRNELDPQKVAMSLNQRIKKILSWVVPIAAQCLIFQSRFLVAACQVGLHLSLAPVLLNITFELFDALVPQKYSKKGVLNYLRTLFGWVAPHLLIEWGMMPTIRSKVEKLFPPKELAIYRVNRDETTTQDIKAARELCKSKYRSEVDCRVFDPNRVLSRRVYRSLMRIMHPDPRNNNGVSKEDREFFSMVLNILLPPNPNNLLSRE